MEAMKALARDRRGFIYYTDTPLPQSLQWNTDMPQRRSFFRRLARRQRLKWIFRHADSVLATGRPGVRAVIDLGCLPEKAVVFPYWVALPRVTHEYRRRHEFRIIGVGQLIYRKGYDIALQALRQAIDVVILRSGEYIPAPERADVPGGAGNLILFGLPFGRPICSSKRRGR